MSLSQNPQPTVSVITVCFNSERNIEETITSLINQSSQDFEHIVVDGGSTDNTLNIIHKYRNYISKIVSEPDQGIYNAMNKGIDLAQGKLISFLNADDYYYKDTIKQVINKYQQTKANVIVGREQLINQYSQPLTIISVDYNQVSKENFQTVHPSTFIATDILKTYKFREKYEIISDYDLLLRLFLDNYTFHNLDYTTTAFRIGGSSEDFKAIFETLDINFKHLGIFTALPHLKTDTLTLIRKFRNKLIYHEVLKNEDYIALKHKIKKIQTHIKDIKNKRKNKTSY